MTSVLTSTQVLFLVQLSRLKHHSWQNLPIFMWMFVYTQLSKLHIIASCSALSNLVQRYVEVHLRVHFLLERKAIAWGSKWIQGRKRVVWAQMIHVPVSLRQCRLSSISNDTPLEIIAGQGVVHSLRNGFATCSECGKSFRILSPVFSSYSMTWERRGNVLMWKNCKRDLSHIIITLHSVSKKPTVRKNVLGIWGTFGYLRTNRNLSVSGRLSDFLVYNCSLKSLTILCSCVLSFVMSSPSFIILFRSFLFLDESS